MKATLRRGQWANFLIDDRALANWRDYGADIAEYEIDKDWRHFLWYRDARELALIPKTIKEKAEEAAGHEFGHGLSPSGEAYWERVHHDRSILDVSSREKNAWISAFIEAYRTRLDEFVSDLIPAPIMDNLPLFCQIVSRVSQGVIEGDLPEDAWGFRLGAKKEEQKIHPKKAEILKRAKEEGIREADLHWGWAEKGMSSLQSLSYPHSPFTWKLTEDEETLYVDLMTKAFHKRMAEIIEDFFPNAPWDHAYLICSLYDEMEVQKARGRKHASDKGWGQLRYHRRQDEYQLRREIEEEVRAQQHRLNESLERQKAILQQSQQIPNL